MSPATRRFVVSPGGRVAGEMRVPGDKSISHRAAMLGAIADGTTEIHGFLDSADCDATVFALSAMGVQVERLAPGHVLVHGRGLRGLRAPAGPLDLANSGTSMRLLTGILAGQAFDTTLVGDGSLMQRPMERIAAPLRRMGADVRTSDGRAPISIRGGRLMTGCDHVLDVPSAQVKSALLFAGLYARGRTRVREPAVSRDHSERMLESFGVSVIREDGAVGLAGPAGLRARRVSVPGDFSSAAYFLAAALVAGSGPFTVRGVGVNPTRTALLDILRLMGADIRVHAMGTADAEPVADIEARPGVLRGIVVPPSMVPAAIDELPLLFAIAALARGETVVTNAAELRVKESDRIDAMAAGLAALGISVEVQPDGMRLRGGAIRGGTVDSRGDHRVAMAFAVLAAKAESPVKIDDVQNVGTSFPGFAQAARAAGLRLAEEA